MLIADLSRDGVEPTGERRVPPIGRESASHVLEHFLDELVDLTLRDPSPEPPSHSELVTAAQLIEVQARTDGRVEIDLFEIADGDSPVQIGVPAVDLLVVDVPRSA